MNIDLKRPDGSRLKAAYQTGGGKTEGTAVFLPGYAYSTEAPLFHFLRIPLLERGWSVLSLDYRYNENENFLSLSDGEQDEYVSRDVAMIGDCLERDLPGEPLLFAAKSLGTSILWELLLRRESILNREGNRFIWMTPARRNGEIVELLEKFPLPSLYLIGGADSFYREDHLKRLDPLAHVRTGVIPESGHIFQKTGDIGATMDNTARVITSALEWIEGARV